MVDFVVSGMKVIFEEKDIPMLKDALSSLRLQVRSKNERDANSGNTKSGVQE
jgi:hypothetical protein